MTTQDDTTSLVKNKSKLAVFLIFGVMFIWAVDYIIIEYAVKFMDQTQFVFMRDVMALVVITIICLIKFKGIKFHKKDFLALFIAGALTFSIYSNVETTGIEYTSASFASLIMATIPAFGLVLDRIFYGKKITMSKIICICMSICGVALLVIGDPLNSNLIGLAILLLSVAIWLVMMLITKPLYAKYNICLLMWAFFLAGSITQFPIMMTREVTFDISPSFLLLLFVDSLIILLGQLGYTFVLGNLSITLVSASENLLPIMTIGISFVVFGTMLKPLQILGAIIILGAIMTIVLKEKES